MKLIVLYLLTACLLVQANWEAQYSFHDQSITGAAILVASSPHLLIGSNGKVLVYSCTKQCTLKATLSGDEPSFGKALAINQRFVAIGGSHADGGNGKVDIFAISKGAVVQKKSLTVNRNEFDVIGFGQSLAMSKDDVLAVAAQSAGSGPSKVFLFTADRTGQFGLLAVHDTPNDWQELQLAVSSYALLMAPAAGQQLRVLQCASSLLDCAEQHTADMPVDVPIKKMLLGEGHAVLLDGHGQALVFLAHRNTEGSGLEYLEKLSFDSSVSVEHAVLMGDMLVVVDGSNQQAWVSPLSQSEQRETIALPIDMGPVGHIAADESSLFVYYPEHQAVHLFSQQDQQQSRRLQVEVDEAQPTSVPTGKPAMCFSSEQRIQGSSFSFFRHKCVPDQYISQAPTMAPTEAPTSSPTARQICAPYFTSDTDSASNANSDTSCTFDACGGTALSLSTCPGCIGDTYVRVFNPDGGMVAYGDDNCLGEQNIQCTSFSFYLPVDTECKTYTVWAGCFSSNSCSGQVVIDITAGASAPSRSPTRAVPAPNPRPNQEES